MKNGASLNRLSRNNYDFNVLKDSPPSGTPIAMDSPKAGARRPCLGRKMKLIISVIKPFKLEEVREALTAIGVQGLMVSEVKGFGRQSGHTEIYRGAEYVVNFVPKIKLEIVAPDDQAEGIVETIVATARTGKIGDGKIFVLDVEQAVRVRTDERGDDAL